MSDNIMMNTDVSKLTEICFRILLCLFGILGNASLLLFTIPTGNRRIEPYKILLINLALSDLLTNCMVDIPGILVEIYGTWFLGDLYCKIFWFTASLSITNSILTTLGMSIFWSQKLVGSRPINCNILRSAELRCLRILVSLGWLISVTFSVPFLFFGGVYIMKNQEVEEGEEQDQQKPLQNIFGCHNDFPSRSQKHVYEVLYLVLGNALPILGMFFINIRIIIFLIRNRKRVSALRCLKTKTTLTSSGPGCGEHGADSCQLTGGQVGNGLMSCISSISNELEFASAQTIWTSSEDSEKDNIKNVDKANLIKQVLNSLHKDIVGDEENNHLPAMVCNPGSCKESGQTTEICDLKPTHLDLDPKINMICIDGNTNSSSFTSYQELCIQENKKNKLPEDYRSLDTKGQLAAKTSKKFLSATTRQIRAALSIMAVVGVFLIFWVTYLTLKIREDTNSSQHVIDTTSLIAASYTTIVPYIFIYSMKKCPCGGQNSQ